MKLTLNVTNTTKSKGAAFVGDALERDLLLEAVEHAKGLMLQGATRGSHYHQTYAIPDEGYATYDIHWELD